jgi:hypothetical protein
VLQLSSTLAWLAISASTIFPDHAAHALTLEDVTPPVAPSGPLSPREEAVIRIFETSAPAVVNIVDVSLPVGGRFIPEADVPEGNGTGIVWDQQGHVSRCQPPLPALLLLPAAHPAAAPQLQPAPHPGDRGSGWYLHGRSVAIISPQRHDVASLQWTPAS